MDIFAPAKINLHLAVKNRRSDGFHDIESVFLALNWGDRLFFDCDAAEETLFIRGYGEESSPLSATDNIILRALALFREKTGFSRKVKITLEKHIPIGGGLGGGSSDAAAALLALNRIAASPLRKDDLLEMGAALGSDVPFFLHETPAAWVTGRGERIEPIDAPQMFLTLVNPGFPSNTAEAFRLLDEHRDAKTLTPPLHVFESASSLLVPPSLYVENFQNDFLEVFKEREKSIYNKICYSLRELGAVFAGLSGSGSTCFGIFEEKEHSEKAAETLRCDWSFVHCCNSKV